MSLYLKYRPSDFTNLVGQSFVKETLQKAIVNNKIVGAYLLCGPRGTGKTSTARLLAKTMNCLNPDNGNPCLKCEICIAFAENKLIDIIEIDAASHTGVDNIREIIEKAQFSPTKTKYKVYIIDEVHMLSKGAFNALLKILEEPPSHVKFILATTETHKVPETIISRCQRYDFKRISDNDIKDRLGFIAKSENIKTDIKSIEYIIKNSSGGLRNAISLFEQLISNGELNYDEIVKKLEIVDENEISSFLDKLINKDNSVIEIFEKNISDGKNIKLFFKELLFFTKSKSLSELKVGNSITDYIFILETFDKKFRQAKNSIDENTTFLIGILKVLDRGNNIEKINKTPILNSFPLQEKETVKNNKKTDNKVASAPGIKLDDIGDIFGSEEENTTKPLSGILSPSQEKETANKSNSFDSNKLIEKIKENGAKGGLTMALRGCNISYSGNTLNISVKTKIAKGQIENVDNMNIIVKSLENIGISDCQIKII